MADMNNVLLQDDEDSTVTLIPISNADKNLVWRSNAASVPIDGQARLTMTWDRLKSGDFRLSAKLEVPVMESIGTSAASGYVAAPKVAFVMVGIFTLFVPSRSTIEDRANIVRMMTHLISGAGSTVDQAASASTGAAHAFKELAAGYVLPYSFINLAMPN